MDTDFISRAPFRGSIRIPLASICIGVLLLSACGAGTDTNSATGAVAKAFLPSSWTGRAPTYEVINGITVPPEPAPSLNNATLTGIDINNNRVRDDVERFIVVNAKPGDITYLNSYYSTIAEIFAKDWSGASRAEALAFSKKLVCLNLSESAISLIGKANGLHNKIFNTKARLDSLEKQNTALGGGYTGWEVRCE